MHTTITTTITTRVDLETFTPDHSVDIDAEDSALPEELVRAAAAGGCRAALKALGVEGEDAS